MKKDLCYESLRDIMVFLPNLTFDKNLLKGGKHENMMNNSD